MIVTEITRKNIRNLYAEIFWFGILAGTTVTFLAVYASHIGANGFQVGLLSAGPAVINLIVSVPAGGWLTGRSLYHISYKSGLYQRLFYLVIAVLPWLFGDKIQVWALIALSLIIAIPGGVMAIAFNAMLADIVPPGLRGEVVGKRNALVAISMTITILISGEILTRVIFPINYQVIFSLGALGGLLSMIHIRRIMPHSSGLKPPIVRQDEKRQEVQIKARLLRFDLLRGSFGFFMLAYLAFYTFQFAPQPLFPLFVVRELLFSDKVIGIGNALFYSVSVVFALLLSRFSRRFGHRKVLVISGLFFAVYPLLVGLAVDTSLYYAASILGGVVWGLISGSLLNRLMERVPEGDRPAHMALHNIIFNLGILIGSLGGPLLGSFMDLRTAILVTAGLRMLAGVLMLMWG